MQKLFFIFFLRFLTLSPHLLMRLDTIINDPSIHQILETYAQKYGVHPWTNFMNLLNRQDMFIAHMSARLISKVLVNSKTLMDGSDLEFYFGWLRSQLVELKQDYLQSSVSCLMNILKINFYREEFYEFDGIGQLMPLLNPTYGFQLQYQVCFCFWLLSYHTKIVSKFQENMKILTTLSDVLKDSQKVKVIRMIIATFVNILKNTSEKAVYRKFSLCLITCKVPRTLELILENHCNVDQQKKGSSSVDLNNNLESKPQKSSSSSDSKTKKEDIDEDLLNDAEFLQKALLEAEANLSSFDEYLAELNSGRLSFSPVHKNCNFWLKNINKFNENRYAILIKLGHILENPGSDILEIRVACHDLGEYSRYYPRGKQVLESLGIKPHIMRLMAHKDKLVKYEALMAVQKIMVQNWEFMGEKGSDGGAVGGLGSLLAVKWEKIIYSSVSSLFLV